MNATLLGLALAAALLDEPVTITLVRWPYT